MEPTVVQPQHGIVRCADGSSEWADELPLFGAGCCATSRTGRRARTAPAPLCSSSRSSPVLSPREDLRPSERGPRAFRAVTSYQCGRRSPGRVSSLLSGLAGSGGLADEQKSAPLSADGCAEQGGAPGVRRHTPGARLCSRLETRLPATRRADEQTADSVHRETRSCCPADRGARTEEPCAAAFRGCMSARASTAPATGPGTRGGADTEGVSADMGASREPAEAGSDGVFMRMGGAGLEPATSCV
jgi:hypothetical protein